MLGVASLVAAMVATAAPRAGRTVLAVFPPWWSAGSSLTAASNVAPALGVGAFSFLVAVKNATPRVAADLRASGALIVVDAARFQSCAALSREQI